MPTDDGGTTKVVLLPLLMGGRRPGVRHALPQVGEHTEEILARLPCPSAVPEPDHHPHLWRQTMTLLLSPSPRHRCRRALRLRLSAHRLRSRKRTARRCA